MTIDWKMDWEEICNKKINEMRGSLRRTYEEGSKTYKFSVNRIKDYHKNKTNKLLKINCHSGLSLECTEEHPILTRKGWKKARELGKARMEGRDYVMQDGDVVEFKIGT